MTWDEVVRIKNWLTMTVHIQFTRGNVSFRVCGSYIKKYTSEQQHWTAESARHAQERISSVRTVRAFGHDRLENEKYSSLVRKVQEMTEKEARAQSQGSKDKNRTFYDKKSCQSRTNSDRAVRGSLLKVLYFL